MMIRATGTVLFMAVAGCSGESPARARDLPVGGGLESEPLRAAEVTGSFHALPASETGIDFRNDYDWSRPDRHLFEHGFAGAGVALGDVNGDDLPDVYLVGRTRPDALYLQRSPLVFEDATLAAGLDTDLDWGTGAALADVDADDDLDLYVCHYDAPNQLWINRGDGTFHEDAQARGLAFRGASVMASFADVDLDGDLDLYLVTNRMYPGPALDVPRTEVVDGVVRVVPGTEEAYSIIAAEVDGVLSKYVGKSGQADHLYRNDGAGRFTDVTLEAGLLENAPGLSATWWDFDLDLDPDLYVANDYFAPDRLYENQGDGTFVEVLGEMVSHTPWFSMGSAAGDLDGDGRLDLVATDMSATTHYRSKIMMGDMNDSRWFLESAEPRQSMRNAVYLSTGTERFMEAAFLSGLASTDWTWSVKLADLDCDGWVDAYFTNGSANNTFDPDLTREVDALGGRLAREGRTADEIREARWQLYRSKEPRAERNLAFRNDGELHFTNASEAWGLDDEAVSYGAALADLDRDGDLELVVNSLGAPAAVYANGMGGSRALLRLVGQRSATRGTGAVVEARAGGLELVRQAATESGYMSSDEDLVHLGLGAAKAIDRLRVRWPSGHVQEFEDLPAGQLYTVIEPATAPPPLAVEAASPRWFSSNPAVIPHTVPPESPFDDFAAQPLLPARLSRRGPALTWGDADGDGDSDLFVGGSAGHPGTLWLAREGAFEPLALAAEARSEDLGALLFDADADGTTELFVTSGSNQFAEGAEELADRLYTNLAAGARRLELPVQSTDSGVVCAADVDRDGDLDLFVGGLAVPARYPETARSRLLLNDGGVFRDATRELAPALERVGLVQAALWSDVENDGDPDLLIACEWGPVSLFTNDGGALVDSTESAGLANLSGWWNGIAAGDVDGDGDLDYAVTNSGLNTKYKPPALLYSGDFAGEGRARLVEAKAGTVELPVRGLSCSSDAMPVLREKLPTYDAFARATLAEIYSPERLAAAERLEARELASGLFLNESVEGEPSFTWRPLPRIVQAAPGYGVLFADLDADGDEDLVLVQNSFQREPETGRWDGGIGAILANDGTGELGWVEPALSGFVVPGDATALTLADWNHDARPDLLVARNEGPLLAFERTAGPSWVALSLVGLPGNATAVGARVTARNGPAAGVAHELAAGGGHLSQSTPLVFLAPPAEGELEVEVRWPDGKLTTHRCGRSGQVVLRK